MERDKALGLFRMRVTGALDPFRIHGLYVFIPDAVNEIVRLAQELMEELQDGESTRPMD